MHTVGLHVHVQIVAMFIIISFDFWIPATIMSHDMYRTITFNIWGTVQIFVKNKTQSRSRLGPEIYFVAQVW